MLMPALRVSRDRVVCGTPSKIERNISSGRADRLSAVPLPNRISDALTEAL